MIPGWQKKNRRRKGRRRKKQPVGKGKFDSGIWDIDSVCYIISGPTKLYTDGDGRS